MKAKFVFVSLAFFFLLLGNIASGGENSINFIRPDRLKKIKYLYFFPMYCGPGVWDNYLKKNAGKISSEIFKRFVRDPQNKSLFKEFPLKVRGGIILSWKLKKKGLDLYHYSYKDSLKIPELLGKKRVIYTFPKIKIFKFNRKNKIAILKTYFYIFDSQGENIGRRRIKIILKNGDLEEGFNEVKDAPEIEELKIPLKYVILLKLMDNTYSEFFRWLSGILREN